MYDTLGFTLLKKCTAKCDICCFESAPSDEEKLDINRVKEYIEQSKELEQIKTIAFTGGEPFLVYEELLELVRLAKAAGKKPNTITNGFWAADGKTAFSRLKELKAAGIDYLSLSYDAYHGQYIDVNNIRNILNAAAQLGISTTLSIVKIKGEKIGDILDQIGSDIYTANIKIVPCLPSGRAAKMFHEEQFDRTILAENCRCPYGGNLVVLYDGKIYPCCSQEVPDTNLSIGDFNTITLKEALQRVKNNGLLYFLRNTDFRFFTEYAQNELGMELPQKVVNPCELCAILFKENKAGLFYDYVVENIKELKRQMRKDEERILS
ncbi:radical SAM/SPASM domain-containing protein [[Clostridium] polysaccharolyticum]|uniref:Peptide modification radical SAM enzyme, YydG family n=1 Tax=[Clostridium] polysaccharolyticum TaxID=29364 RepID=A0A1I0CBU5_9FIRM|nr:radical SAM protein [[Clostridium] polysaccharolyticum]SET16990.1 peptide modification radical SAM enzyme, YydG family [[Clostridium] polysaccharolyticum]